MSKWEYVRLGDLLVESKIPSENPDPSKRITVKLNVGGVEKRPYIEEVEGSTKYYIRKAGQFIYGKQNLHKGAFGIIPKELDGYESTIDLPAFDINTNRVLPEWLMLVFIKDNFYKELESISSGSATKRIHPERLFEVKIPLPSINEQRNILNKYNRFKSNIEEINKLLIDMSNYITKLRQNILQEAVQGKLVPQDPNDEPTSVLLERIKEEKERLIKEGKIKKEKPLPPISEDEIPYELPEGWEWVRLGEICYNFGQKKPDEKFTYIDVSSINKDRGIIKEDVNILNPQDAPSRARKIVRKGTVIYSTVRPYLLNTAIVDREFEYAPIVSTAFAVMHTFNQVYNKYLYYYLRSIPFIKFVESQMVGMAYPAISEGNLFRGPFPLPPLNEQKRIVEKVDQLMALCDELEKNIEQSKNDSELLMQSVLQEAFKEA